MPANLARSAGRFVMPTKSSLASLAKPSRPHVGLHRTSKDGTYNLWLSLATCAWVLRNLRVGFAMYKRSFSTSSCVRLALATHAWLMSHKNGPITTSWCIDRTSCNSCVAYVVHKRPSAEARPNSSRRQKRSGGQGGHAGHYIRQRNGMRS